MLALARLWWRDAFPATSLGPLANFEIGWQALYLTKVWDAVAEEVLVGVGDQLNGTQLLMYEDFGSADFALQVRLPLRLFGCVCSLQRDAVAGR